MIEWTAEVHSNRKAEASAFPSAGRRIRFQSFRGNHMKSTPGYLLMAALAACLFPVAHSQERSARQCCRHDYGTSDGDGAEARSAPSVARSSRGTTPF